MRIAPFFLKILTNLNYVKNSIFFFGLGLVLNLVFLIFGDVSLDVQVIFSTVLICLVYRMEP